MRTIAHRPDASAIVNSLRAIGYSFNTALADIIDNSLAAGATLVDIGCRLSPEPYVAIIDDGCGMAPQTLLEAMRHGGTGPAVVRRREDLGRYGLGLKTASLSQCRTLCVVTMADGNMCAAAWELDLVEATNEWSLKLFETDEVLHLPRVEELVARGHGTIVIWRDFDRATAGEHDEPAALARLVDESRPHLSLVFHRYVLPHDEDSRCAISINALPLEPYDPFIRSNRFTERLPTETVEVEREVVSIQPFILPHLTNISELEMRRAGGVERLRQTQGFYIYRSRRLISHGTWFRLVRHDELTKLARVQVDIPNSLDHLWGLDVKKSTANPPDVVRARLRRITDRIANRGANVFRERRRRANKADTVHLWDRSLIRNSILYTINRQHPLVDSLAATLAGIELTKLEQLLRALEIALPADSIFADLSADQSVQPIPHDMVSELRTLAEALLEPLKLDKEAYDRLRAALPALDPFSMYPTFTERMIEALDV